MFQILVGHGTEIGGQRCFWVWYGQASTMTHPGPSDSVRFFLYDWDLDG